MRSDDRRDKMDGPPNTSSARGASLIPLLGLVVGALGMVPSFAMPQEILRTKEALRTGRTEEIGEVTAADYSRASGLLPWNTADLVVGGTVEPNWIAGSDRFWYRNNSGEGFEFIVVDPIRNIQEPLFDRHRLAAAISLAADSSYTGEQLPFRSFEFVGGETHIGFDAREKRFECDIRAYACTVGTAPPYRAHIISSPDGHWEAFIHEYDLFVRPTENPSDSLRLTHDGEELRAYGIQAPMPTTVLNGVPEVPVLEWSPDSKKIAVQRMNETGVGMVMLYSSTSQRPRPFIFPYGQPGDSLVPRWDIHVVDVEAQTNLRVPVPSQPIWLSGVSGLSGTDWVTVRWGPDSNRLFFTHGTRGSKRIQLMVTTPGQGEPRILAKDTAATFVELHMGGRSPPNWALLGGGEQVVWYSTRDGWGHLYRYDDSGRLLNRISSGPWSVEEIKHIDEERGQIYFTAWGREGNQNPYHAHLYRVGLDGTNLSLLTPEDGHHAIEFSPSGRFFLDSYSTVASPPVTVLRSVPDGRVVRTVEEADISRLLEAGWRPPETFTVKARDGVTDLWGLMFKPARFDPSRMYPVIENIYPGPQIGSVRTWGFSASGRGDAHALAELGFIVIQLDHMGTPARSKAFLDTWWGNMGDNGLPDHVAALRQLAGRHPFLDLDRVGIYGHSGGGFASTDAILRYPDVYKVAVSGSGNHDNRTFSFDWGEKYQGLLKRDTIGGTDNYQNQVNASLAGNLKGKLLLMHGDLDDNVLPALTLQVVDALIKANKSFDLLLAPDRHHGLNEPYFIRRRWDYFVEHLLEVKPPVNFEIRGPER
jgi:dipeptidyl-peptidase-4